MRFCALHSTFWWIAVPANTLRCQPQHFLFHYLEGILEYFYIGSDSEQLPEHKTLKWRRYVMPVVIFFESRFQATPSAVPANTLRTRKTALVGVILNIYDVAKVHLT